jgi:hypothetical protein
MGRRLFSIFNSLVVNVIFSTSPSARVPSDNDIMTYGQVEFPVGGTTRIRGTFYKSYEQPTEIACNNYEANAIKRIPRLKRLPLFAIHSPL